MENDPNTITAWLRNRLDASEEGCRRLNVEYERLRDLNRELVKRIQALEEANSRLLDQNHDLQCRISTVTDVAV